MVRDKGGKPYILKMPKQILNIDTAKKWYPTLTDDHIEYALHEHSLHGIGVIEL